MERSYFKMMAELYIVAEKLTEKEKRACAIMSELKYDNERHYFKCEENDKVLEEARKAIDGADPIALWKQIFCSMPAWEEDVRIAQIDNLI